VDMWRRLAVTSGRISNLEAGVAMEANMQDEERPSRSALARRPGGKETGVALLAWAAELALELEKLRAALPRRSGSPAARRGTPAPVHRQADAPVDRSCWMLRHAGGARRHVQNAAQLLVASSWGRPPTGRP
jgi:hypothetical protein